MEINIISSEVIVMTDYIPQALRVGIFGFERLAPCTNKSLALYMWWNISPEKKFQDISKTFLFHSLAPQWT